MHCNSETTEIQAGKDYSMLHFHNNTDGMISGLLLNRYVGYNGLIKL